MAAAAERTHSPAACGRAENRFAFSSVLGLLGLASKALLSCCIVYIVAFFAFPISLGFGEALILIIVSDVIPVFLRLVVLLVRAARVVLLQVGLRLLSRLYRHLLLQLRLCSWRQLTVLVSLSIIVLVPVNQPVLVIPVLLALVAHDALGPVDVAALGALPVRWRVPFVIVFLVL